MPPRRAASLAVLLAAALGSCSRAPVAPPRAALDPVATVTVAPVVLRPLGTSLAADGVLVSRQEAAVASELAGYRIAAVYADEGDWVRKGQPLARLDDALLRAQIAEQRANLQVQEVGGERARAEAERVRGLDDAGVISNEQIAERRLAAKAADAQVAYARAQLQDLETRDGRLVLRAPASGRVLEKSARPGDVSAPSAVLFRIVVDGRVELDAEAPQAALGSVRAGDPVEVAPATGGTVTGRVRFVSPRVDAASGLGHVRVALPVRDDLRPGGFARAVFRAPGRTASAVPEAALHFDADGPAVMVVSHGRAHRVPVRTGAREGGFVELVSGPPVGSEVALGGGAFVLDGDPVRVAASSPGAAAR